MKPVAEWNLRPREREAIEAVIESGSNKGAARILGVSVKTIDVYLTEAIRKSEAGSFSSGRLHMLLAYDRSTRGNA